MNRRQFFQSLTTVGSSASSVSSANRPSDTFEMAARRRPVSGLQPYSGAWNEQTAAHLLRRAMFGATPAQIRQAVQQGLNATLNQLLQDRPAPEPPVDITTGQTWHDKPFNSEPNADGRYYTYLRAWWIGLMINQPISLIEKMTLFWHNHFVSDRAANADARYLYRQNTLFRRFALGNFKALTLEVTIDPAMLRYLNGNVNVSGRPNQNYARELFELFTIGKGPELAQGNYTNYTEQDVAAAARVLTGWRDLGYRSTTIPIGVIFDMTRHDTGNKQFSSAFQNTVIRGRNSASAGMEELTDLLDMIFQQAETARFIVRKLYRWFVYYVIDATVERNIIEPLAQQLRQNNYELRFIRQVGLQSIQYASQIRAAAERAQNRATYPAANANRLADQLRIVARLIAGGLQTRIYHVSLGGFDTHAAQVTATDTTTGTHANLLRLLSQALSVFQDDLRRLGVAQRVLTMTFSEFGRTVRSNGSTGTDHGTAAPLFIIGEAVRSGIIGVNPNLTNLVNNQLAMQFDFRQVYASVLAQWFGVGAAQLRTILQRDFAQLPITGASSINDDSSPKPTRFELAQNYPNPFNPTTTIRYQLPTATTVKLSVFDMLGRELATLVNARQPAGMYQVNFDARGLASGVYLYRLTTPEFTETKKMMLVK
jgi:uncharacterized protein (DUF1800 family)